MPIARLMYLRGFLAPLTSHKETTPKIIKITVWNISRPVIHNKIDLVVKKI